MRQVVLGPRPRRARRGAAAVCLLASLIFSACHSNRPLSSPQPARGTRVVARLTDAGSARMAPLIGTDVVAVEAVVGEARDDEWELLLLRVESRGGTGAFWNREAVRFPREALTDVRERRLDRKRSYLTAAGITAGAILLGRAFGTGGFLGIGGDGGEPNPGQ